MTEQEFKDRLTHLSRKTTGEMLYDRSWDVVKDICEIVQPKSILELGFNRGASALMWLNNTPEETKLHSVDKRSEKEVSISLEYLGNMYGERFKYTTLDHSLLTETYTQQAGMVNKYDLIFIDGDHNAGGVLRDALNSIKMNPKYIAFDDYFHGSHSKDIKAAIEKAGLEIIKEYVNPSGQVLTKNPFYKYD